MKTPGQRNQKFKQKIKSLVVILKKTKIDEARIIEYRIIEYKK